jgi:hypothetical protein
MSMSAVDDLIAVLDVGAYGYTESMPLFLSHSDGGRRPRRYRGADPTSAGPRYLARSAARTGSRGRRLSLGRERLRPVRPRT